MNESKPYVNSADDCSKYYVYWIKYDSIFEVSLAFKPGLRPYLIDITDNPVTINDYPELLI